MSELKNFLYELNNMTTQAHTLKDAYEKLNDSEKAIIMKHAPKTTEPPNMTFEQTVQWLRALNDYFSVDK